MLTVDTLLPLLLGKTPSEVAAVKAEAEKVVLGLTTSISALNQSATFARDDAATILEAVIEIERRRRCNPDAGPDSLAARTLAHPLRLGRQVIWGP